MLEITSAQRRELRSRAHALVPVVLLGGPGLTNAVVAEIERNLLAHELIKIRAAGADRNERDAMLASICEQTGSASVQHIGKILVIYRPAPKKAEASGRPARTSGYSADANKRLSGRAGSGPRSTPRKAGGRADDSPDGKSRASARKRPAKARPTTRR